MTQPNGEALRRWIGIGLLLVGWLVSAAWFSSSYATRLSAVERNIDQKVSQQEFNDMKERLTRIEDKLDKALQKK